MEEDSTYPTSHFIKLYDKKRTFYYKIIKEGTYPLTNQLHYIRNSKHPISHNYIVKTQYGKANHIVKYSINYVKEKPLFKVNFGANFVKEVYSLESSTKAACKYYQEFKEATNKGKISGPLLFSLKLLSVERTEKENMFHSTDQIKFKQVKFESYNDLYDINFGQLNIIEEIKRIEAVVKSLDRNHILREAYRSLVKNIPLTLVNLLQPTIFEPITEEPHITDNAVITNMLESIDDGCNVSHKIKHVMVTIILLNDLNGLQKPDNNYILVLYPGAESYESLKNTLTPLISDLSILKEKGFDQIGNKINTTTKIISKSMNKIRDNYNQIDDRLWELMLSDLCHETTDEEIWKEKILLEMQRLKITFQFWHEKNSNNLSYTSLMGSDKLKILKEFNLIAIFQLTERAIQLQEL
ncbi:hypothetical protein C1646_765216 [Rhizophagus diaphanus]|nr:hypothetical protein C1646_765216 [Rhizophagus diaphanus] [Rhizophagus sp. MUCL 43196]